MKQICQRAREIVVWLYDTPSTTFDESAAWNIVKNDKDRWLTKLLLWSLKRFHTHGSCESR